MINDFPLTAEGYDAAIQWLKDSGRNIEETIRSELSTDGFTIVNLVNHLRRKEQVG